MIHARYVSVKPAVASFMTGLMACCGALSGCQGGPSDEAVSTTRAAVEVASTHNTSSAPGAAFAQWEPTRPANIQYPKAGPIDIDPAVARHPGLSGNKNVTKPTTPPTKVAAFVVSDAARARQVQFDAAWANEKAGLAGLSVDEISDRRAALKSRIVGEK